MQYITEVGIFDRLGWFTERVKCEGASNIKFEFIFYMTLDYETAITSEIMCFNVTMKNNVQLLLKFVLESRIYVSNLFRGLDMYIQLAWNDLQTVQKCCMHFTKPYSSQYKYIDIYFFF